MNPWNDKHTIWRSRAAFFSWLRGQLRKSWTKYPLKNSFLREKRFRACVGIKGRDVWACRCAECNEVFPQSKVQVDHIIPAGSLKSWDDVPGFCERLFTSTDQMQILCIQCHQLITYAFIHNVPKEDVHKHLAASKFSQLKAHDQREKLVSLGIEPESNNDGRVQQFKKHFKL